MTETKTETEGTVESGEWVAVWGVYGPFERTKWGLTKISYWEWRTEFYKPDGELITWYGVDEFSFSRPYITRERPTRDEAAKDAVRFATDKLEALRHYAEPVESGVITLASEGEWTPLASEGES